MNIQSHLDELRDDISGCVLTAFGDLSSDLILRSSSTGTMPRERLDQLCETAAWSFDVVEAMEQSDGPRVKETEQTVVYFNSKTAKVFARNTAEPHDVTCTLVNAGHGLDRALQKTADAAAIIGQVD